MRVEDLQLFLANKDFFQNKLAINPKLQLIACAILALAGTLRQVKSICLYPVDGKASGSMHLFARNADHVNDPVVTLPQFR
jgi:hypothetical protein